VGFDLSVAPQKQRTKVGAGHVLRSSGSLRLQVSRYRISQSNLKTGGDVTVGGARGIITEITWS
jgi:hypothetical protein